MKKLIIFSLTAIFTLGSAATFASVNKDKPGKHKTHKKTKKKKSGYFYNFQH